VTAPERKRKQSVSRAPKRAAADIQKARKISLSGFSDAFFDAVYTRSCSKKILTG
jgi:hypothetical protein